MKKQGRKAYSLKSRFNYWFDNRMTKGSMSFIRFLIAASVILAVIIAVLIIVLKFNEESEADSVFWNSIATLINGWMPSYEDGSRGYIVLLSISAIAGLLFTSVFIGIITSAIEEKVGELKRGNSDVLENGHTVVLGFTPGEYTLLEQLILAAEDEPSCIVIAEDMDREEMEQALAENLEVPKNVRLVCRTVDITDPASLEKCSLESSDAVIISPADEARTVKALLAVSALADEKDADIRVSALMPHGSHRFPRSLAQSHHITTLQTNTLMAKVMAHSCTQLGLAETFREVFNFDGFEFHPLSVPELCGRTFEEAILRMDNGVPVGIISEGNTELAPSAERVIAEGESLLVFADGASTTKLGDQRPVTELPHIDMEAESAEKAGTVIIGHNETLPTILHELPENVKHVLLCCPVIEEDERNELERAAAERGLTLGYFTKDISDEENLVELASDAAHIVVLNDHDLDGEDADMEVIFLLLTLRDIRDRLGLGFNITVEMQKESNQSLVGSGDYTDFLVTTSLSSLFLAQLAENPRLAGVFRELLSNDGNELFLKNAASAGLSGGYSVRQLRAALLRCGYILLGVVGADKKSRFDLPLDSEITLSGSDSLIVLGED